MYDSGKVIAGIVIFIVLMTSPFWLAIGKQAEFPELEKPAAEKGKKCVESNEYMRANHMQMLDDWRNEVVRDGEREYVSTDGRKFDKSLTRKCLDCHENKKKFCDKCHTYSGVSPYCWTCHVDPKDEDLAIVRRDDDGR
jgi:hypothetical protein